ncbi:beta strand repeat-containing protein [Maribacter dokdonensis]|uniref:beta strand repeat-containing protein n=1 Tax=Maribacter dokdonensis TaxID=320912 RepID=UPI002733AEE6|nr:hypothetical protein [Maribacter dokdonensis]MDP2527677.1 hypothetical protein [Maribacter dokdonensis]
MKAIIFFIFFIFLALPPVFGQIKIGDNPQNIDASSVLELESSSKVLVITRVTTLEMEAIIPQRGGLVYNTDTECVNYYDGTQWVNLCDAVNFTITNDPIINGRSTIEITESAAGYNLEVAKNSILGDNIIDGGIGPDDIQDNSITQDKLAAESVGSSELRQNAVGSVEIRDGSIAPEDMANTIADQVLTTDENGIVQWEDTNDLFDLTFNKLDNTLTISRSTTPGVSTISLEALVGSDDQQLDLTGNILSIENDPNTIDLSTYLQQLSINTAGDEISLTNGGTITLPNPTIDTDEQNLGTTSLANEILTITIENGDPTTADLTPFATDAVVTAGLALKENVANKSNDVTLGNSIDLYPTQNAVKTYVDNTVGGSAQTIVSADLNNSIAQSVNDGGAFYNDGDSDDQNELQDIVFDETTNILTISTPLTTGNEVDLSSLADAPELDDGFIFVGNAASEPTPVAVGGDVTMNNIGEFTIEDEAVTPIMIEPAPGILTEDQVLITTTAGVVEWANFPPGGGGGDDNQNANEVPYDNAASGLTATSTQAAIDELAGAGFVDTDDQNAADVPFTPAGNTTSTDVQAAIVEIQTEIDGITVTGETNTASNQGVAGVPIFIQKNGVDLEFRSINSGSNKIDVSEDVVNNEILVDINEANLTITESQISDLTHTINTDNQNAAAVPFTPAGNTTSTDVQAAIVEIQTEIDGITVTGETNTASNQGVAGVPIFIQKNGVDLEFRSINSGSNKIDVSEDAVNNEILVDINEANLTITESQISDLTHTINTDNQNAAAVPFTPAGNTTSTDVQAAIVEIQTEIDGITVTGETNTASNQGVAGVPTFIQKNGVDLEFRSINSGSNKIAVSEDAVNNEILVDINEANLTITESQISDLTHTINTDNQNAAAVPFTPAGNTTSTDVQAAIVEIQTEIDGLNAGDNLSNTNLTQTADRIYDLDENDLTFDITNSTLIFSGINSNVGIGNISPQDKLDVDGQIRARNGFGANNGSAGAPSIGFYNDSDTGIFRGTLVNYLRFSTAGDEAMIIDPTQNIGIGPTFATGTTVAARLHVDGDIRAEGAITASGPINTVPDYVFQKYFLGNSFLNPSYEFNDLAEIEAFVKENKHLPGIQSAQAVKEQGFWNVSESSRVNLEKIEELFLHTIEQEKKIKELQKANTNMSSELEALKTQMEEIKTMLLEKQNN